MTTAQHTPATLHTPDCCGSCHHNASVHYVRCAVEDCPCNAPDFQHSRYLRPSEANAALLAALEATTAALGVCSWADVPQAKEAWKLGAEALSQARGTDA